MGGMDAMGLFYDRCLETLYPPGICGVFCNTHTFDCYITEVQEACCDEGGQNCVSGEDVPEQCPVGCAIVFPPFLETCANHLEQRGATMEDYRAFAQECLDMDGIELVEYVIMLRESGCVVDLGEEAEGGGSRRALLRRTLEHTATTRRQTQSFFAPLQQASNDGGQCPWDAVNDLASEVDSICCATDEAQCEAGAEPRACSAACAVAVHSFTPCVETLEASGALTNAFQQMFEHFEAECMAAVEGTEEIMQAIMGAVCPDEDGFVDIDDPSRCEPCGLNCNTSAAFRGSYSPDGGATCVDCPNGQYDDDNDAATECVPIPATVTTGMTIVGDVNETELLRQTQAQAGGADAGVAVSVTTETTSTVTLDDPLTANLCRTLREGLASTYYNFDSSTWVDGASVDGRAIADGSTPLDWVTISGCEAFPDVICDATNFPAGACPNGNADSLSLDAAAGSGADRCSDGEVALCRPQSLVGGGSGRRMQATDLPATFRQLQGV